MLCPMRTGHFQIDRRHDTGRSMIGGAPIGHDHTFILPFVPQNASTQPFMLRRIRAIDAIVRTHECFGR
eukprot:scaffold43086_cov183-Amphora_coffeaeformis.AAC.1